MKSIFLMCVLFYALSTAAQNIATFSKRGSKATESIPLQELKGAYDVIFRSSLRPPTPTQFTDSYIKYRIAVSEAYHNSKFVNSPKIRQMIIDPTLKESFNQLLYRHIVYGALEKSLDRLERRSNKLSNKQLRSFYNKNPFFRFQFITVQVPFSANTKQVRNTLDRANDIYSKVRRNKTPWPQLIQIYSDSKTIGQGLIAHPQAALSPSLIKRLKSLRPNQVGAPVKTVTGFFIPKLIEQIPFQKMNKDNLKQQHFSVNRAKALEKYLNRLQSKYKIKIDRNLVKTL